MTMPEGKHVITKFVDNWETMGWRVEFNIAAVPSGLRIRVDFQFRIPKEVQVDPEFKVGPGKIMSFGTQIEIPYWEFFFPDGVSKPLTASQKFRQN